MSLSSRAKPRDQSEVEHSVSNVHTDNLLFLIVTLLLVWIDSQQCVALSHSR